MNVDILTTKKKYQIIYADPPWSYSDKGCAGAAAAQYDTMSVADIAALPVKEIADKTAVLFLWATYPKMEEALQLIKAWGFTFKSIAFQWVKLNKAASKEALEKALETSDTVEEAIKKVCFFGLGRWTRGNSEPCLIAVKGKPSRVSAGVGQLVFAPLGKHSAKPAEVRDRIVELVGGGARIELFAREAADGWDCWGNEAPQDKKQVFLPEVGDKSTIVKVTCPVCGAWIGTKYIDENGSCVCFMTSSDYIDENKPCRNCEEKMEVLKNEQ